MCCAVNTGGIVVLPKVLDASFNAVGIIEKHTY